MPSTPLALARGLQQKQAVPMLTHDRPRLVWLAVLLTACFMLALASLAPGDAPGGLTVKQARAGAGTHTVLFQQGALDWLHF